MIIICYINTAIVEPGLNLTDVEDELRGDNDMTSGDSDSSGIVIAASVVGSLLALGVVVFFIVLFLLIRRKRKASKYNTSLMTPDKVLYNHNGYVPSPLSIDMYCIYVSIVITSPAVCV